MKAETRNQKILTLSETALHNVAIVRSGLRGLIVSTESPHSHIDGEDLAYIFMGMEERLLSADMAIGEFMDVALNPEKEEDAKIPVKVRGKA